MLITEFKITNYKSFRDTPTLNLSTGMTVVVGQNNAGKTAFLEALSLQFSQRPHRTLKTVPQVNWQPSTSSAVEFTCVVTRDELFQMLQSEPKGCWVPVPDASSAFAKKLGIISWDFPGCQTLVGHIVSLNQHEIKLRRIAGSGGAVSFGGQRFPSFGLYEAARVNQGYMYASFDLLPNYSISHVGIQRDDVARDIGIKLAPNIATRVYRFTAERRCSGRTPYGDRSTLNNDASNLPEVLNSLQHNSRKFAEFNSVVSEVLPQVRWVSVRPTNGLNEILVWGIDPEIQRPDLAVPLDESGSGIGHVLAILYVVCTSEFPQTLLIDEPQSFLHPGAARKLIQVLKRYPQHQFIIATHSPVVISAAEPQSIIMIRSDGNGESVVTETDATSATSYGASLRELGVRLSDVYGADNILWVEGPTEEVCFPKLLKALFGKSLMGTVVLAVASTGDFESKNRKDVIRVFSIYKDLSTSNSLMPPAISFIFDRECWSASEAQELRTRSGGLLQFTTRRTYENYLLHSGAIAALLNEVDKELPEPVTAADIDARLLAMSSDDKYFGKSDACKDKSDWLVTIDAAHVLRDIFSEFTSTRVSYEKTRHSVELTDWLLANASETLRELATIVRDALGV